MKTTFRYHLGVALITSGVIMMALAAFMWGVHAR